MKEIVCFIDDSPFEHELVRDIIAPSAPDLEFIQAYTFDEAREKLNEKRPSLFLLDLWGQDREVKNPSIIEKEEIEKMASRLPTLDQVYEGEPDINEFLRRLFTIVDGWRKIFEAACSKAGQNRKYGLENLMLVRKHYPEAAAVIYTRKSLISDAIAVFNAGADGIFIKPTGKDDEETRRLTKEFAPRLILELKKIIRRKAILTTHKVMLSF